MPRPNKNIPAIIKEDIIPSEVVEFKTDLTDDLDAKKEFNNIVEELVEQIEEISIT